jgi:5-methylcytosine-specific restriction endonuclease McrA
MEVDQLWEEFREQLAVSCLDGRHGNISKMRARMYIHFDLDRVCIWCGSDLPKDRRRQWCVDKLCGYSAASRYDWRSVRSSFLHEDGKRVMCKCGERHVSEVHHIVPISDGGNPFDRANLIGLCNPCHLIAHREINDQKDTKAARKRRERSERAAAQAAAQAEKQEQADEYWAQFGGIV